MDDAAEGILMATEFYNESLPVNLGSGYEISIKDLAEKIAFLSGFSGKLTWNTEKPNGQPRRGLDTSRALEKFGFRSKTTFDQGLANTISWFRDHKDEIN